MIFACRESATESLHGVVYDAEDTPGAWKMDFSELLAKRDMLMRDEVNTPGPVGRVGSLADALIAHDESDGESSVESQSIEPTDMGPCLASQLASSNFQTSLQGRKANPACIHLHY